MKCNYCIEDLSRFVDNNISERDRIELEQHLKKCCTCNKNYTALKLAKGFMCKDIKSCENFYSRMTNFIDEDRYKHHRLRYSISTNVYKIAPKLKLAFTASFILVLFIVAIKMFYPYSNLEKGDSPLASITKAIETSTTNQFSTPLIYNKGNDNLDKPSITITDTKLTLENISTQLFGNCLDKFKETDIEFEKIKDYKIESVKIEKSIDTKFEFYIEYSVLPATNKYILAGDGVLDKDGWIVRMSRFVTVKKNDNTYTVESIGTSPSLFPIKNVPTPTTTNEKILSNLFSNDDNGNIIDPETFTDKRFDFSVNYPASWRTEVDKNSTLNANPDRGINIYIEGNKNEKIYVFSQVGPIGADQPSFAHEKFITNEGIDGEITYGDIDGKKQIYLILKGNGYHGAIISVTNECFNNNKKQILGVLKSIKLGTE